MTEQLLTIRQMCDQFDVTPRALRFYEARELLFPQRRGQQRLYGRRDRGRLTLILRGKRFGFSLDEIRQLLALYVPGDANVRQTRLTLDTARERLGEMRQKRDELTVAIAELEHHIAVAEDGLAASETRSAAE